MVAVVNDAIVGALTAHSLMMTRAEVVEIFLYDLAVRPTHQRQGIGRQLVSALREAAGREGIEVVFVPADDEDEHALDFYRAVGGEPAPVTIFTFNAGGAPAPRTPLSRRLTTPSRTKLGSGGAPTHSETGLRLRPRTRREVMSPRQARPETCSN